MNIEQFRKTAIHDIWGVVGHAYSQPLKVVGLGTGTV